LILTKLAAKMSGNAASAVSNGMDAPTFDGIDVPEWKCQPPLEPEGASIPLLTERPLIAIDDDCAALKFAMWEVGSTSLKPAIRPQH